MNDDYYGTDKDKPYGPDEEDALEYELRVIDRRVRLDNKKRKDKFISTVEEAVHTGQLSMLLHPNNYPMADTLFKAECKRRLTNKEKCSYCDLRFKCWTE